MSGFMVLPLATTRAAIRADEPGRIQGFSMNFFRWARANSKLGEVPLNFRPRQVGNSKLDQA